MAEREASEIKTKLLRGVILDSATLMGIVPKEKQLAAVSSLFKEEISVYFSTIT